MRNELACGCEREISAANYNFYKNPELHPDRVMQQHDLVYLLEGAWCIGQDGETFEVGPGDVIVLQAGHYHYGLRVCEPDTRTMYIHFSPLRGDGIISGKEAPDTKTPVTDMVIHCKNGNTVRRLFEEIIENFWSGSESRATRLSALLSLLLCELSDQSRVKAHSSDEAIEAVLRLFIRNPERFFSIQELAGRSFVSTKTLTSRFRRATGRSIHQYQLELKLDMIRIQMQAEPDKSLKELSASYGFYDEFHLSKLFKRKFGAPPSAWLHKNYQGKP
ncbi:MAG: AraC family transcriptional regulator [Clostridia bacterium]|nr:AraC family transcriptional regulator [Clostridia bacterium]